MAICIIHAQSENKIPCSAVKGGQTSMRVLHLRITSRIAILIVPYNNPNIRYEN